MTTTPQVTEELQRFLRSADSEVICVTGDWGVGKTYIWQKVLDELKVERSIALQRYSYVSLFGLNSLDGLKAAIVENLDFLVPEGKSTIERFLSGANQSFVRLNRMKELATAVPFVGGAVAKALPMLFSAVRNQIICIDDLERSGKGLEVKDVLGLASFLKEQRGCKVVLLLNQSKLDENEGKKAFNQLFEKVVDTHLVFAPSSEEAVDIALPSDDQISKTIAEYAVKLQISNIRVLKKIERLIRIVSPHIQNMPSEITRQVVQSVLIFGWSKFDSGANPPPLSYICESEFSRYTKKETASEDEQRWDLLLSAYGFTHADELDLALRKYVDSGVFDREAILKYADEASQRVKQNSQHASIKSSWGPFHNSFDDNSAEVCKSISQGVQSNLDVMSLSNFDSAMSLLIELGQPDAAKQLIELATQKMPDTFWLDDDPFNRELANESLKKIIAQRKETAKKPFHFETGLLEAAQNYDQELITKIAEVPVEDFCALFEKRRGDERNRLILSGLEYRKIANASEEARKVVKKTEDALRMIGRKSRLNAARIKRFGVSVDNAEDQKK